MRHPSNALKCRSFLRLAAAAATLALLAGCSSDANRLTSAFSNPFAAQPDPTPTGVIPPAGQGAYQGSSLSPVTSRPLAAPRQAIAPYAAPARAAYNVPPAASAVRPLAAAAAGWSADGGTPIVAAQGESAAMLARRYGVPEDALLRANGFASASQVQPGSRLIIPVYNGSRAQAAPAASLRPQRAAAAPVAAPAPKLEKTAKLARPHPAPAKPVAEVAEAPAKKVPAKARLADRKMPVQQAKAAPAAQAKQAKVVAPAPGKQAAAPKAPAPMAAAPAKPVPVKTAKLEKPVAAAPKKIDVDPAPVASLPPAAAPAPAATPDAANPEFRWPARGRVIQGFKSGGNDGINIAVPEGTSVKAAESGVVAYAGSELKGYGNLVLIRHPNGFVTAYANNGDIEVKRGETVKRGQTIAKSGQSGNVSSPQLHFELRKGSTPVDPTNYLAGL